MPEEDEEEGSYYTIPEQGEEEGLYSTRGGWIILYLSRTRRKDYIIPEEDEEEGDDYPEDGGEDRHGHAEFET
jgi:hypothetical protein